MKTIILLIFCFFSINGICQIKTDFITSDNQEKNKKYESINVKVISENSYLVGNIKTSKKEFEKTLLNQYKTKLTRNIIISFDKNVSSRHIMFVMDIANSNRIKSIFAVRTK